MTNNNGFSLIEILTTIAIAGVIASMAIPSCRTTIEKNKVQKERDELASHFRLARSTAITKSGTTVICASDDTSTCSQSGDWTDGWIVFINNDADLTAYDSSTDLLLKVSDGIDGEHSLLWSDGGSEVVFESSGEVSHSGTFTFCGNSANARRSRALIVYPTGSFRPSIDVDRNGVPEGLGGVELTC